MSVDRREYQRQWRKDNPDKVQAAVRGWEEKHPGYINQLRAKKKAQGICVSCLSRRVFEDHVRCRKCWRKMNAWMKKNRDRMRAKHRRNQAELRMRAFDAYGGPVCVCCGEIEYDFLTLEHSRQDGAQWRKKLFVKNTSTKTFYWLRDHKYPKNLGLEVLCWNCQWGRKNNNGKCPHET